MSAAAATLLLMLKNAATEAMSQISRSLNPASRKACRSLSRISAGFSVKPTDKTTLALAAHRLWLATNNDAVYTAGGTVLRPGGVSGSDLVGSEVDLTLKFKHDAHTTFLLGYSHFFSGDVIEDSGPSGDADFAYFQVQYVF